VHLRMQDVLPVVISVIIILAVALLEKYSKLFASITATMPLTIVLAIWIVYSANDGNKLVMDTFNLNLLIGLLPTALFVVAAWLSIRAGIKLMPTIGIGYVIWGISSWILILIRRSLGMV